MNSILAELRAQILFFLKKVRIYQIPMNIFSVQDDEKL